MNKSFFLYDQDCFQDPIRLYKADLCMSLDVIYQLVEDSVFETYMENLFNASNKWVVIYSSDRDRTYHGSHVRERAFTEWINSNRPGWKLEEKIDNPYPLEPGNPVTSFANFYFFLNETRKSD